MGCHGDVDAPNDPNKKNTNDDFTQVLDSQFSPPPSPGEKVEDDNNEQLHFCDTVPVEDTYETQEMGLDYDTQALNLGDETQVLYPGEEETQALDLGGETQALYYFDDFENMETQLLDVFDNEVVNDSDNEGSDKTEVLGDTEGMSDDDSTRIGCNRSLEREKMQCTSICEKGMKDLRKKCGGSNLGSRDSTTTPVSEGTTRSDRGYVPRFASIRAASLRASGLAARNVASKEINSESCYFLSSDLCSDQDAVRKDGLEPKVVEEIDYIHDLKENEKEQGLRNGNGNSSRAGSSTVRKLFTEDSVSEGKGFLHNSDNADGGENLLPFSVNDGELAGLSYVDSQEPGELSQANALNFVEMFIEKNNFVEFDHAVDGGKSTGVKSKPVSTAKGPQSLAKKSNDRSKFGKTEIYDWDDSREDEGGGDIFCRRKDEFFGSGCRMQRSLTESKKLKKRKLDLYGDDGEEPNVTDRNMMLSDSKVTLHNITNNEKKTREAQMRFELNLQNELDEQLNADSSGGKQETAVSKADVPHMLDIGPDTQMAAEAMEALLSGEGIANDDVNGMQSNYNLSANVSSRGKTKSRVSKQSPSQKRACISGVGVATRQNKKTKSEAKLNKCSPVSSVKNFKNSRKKCDRKPVIMKKRSSKSMAEQNSTINGRKNVDKASSEIVGQRNVGGNLESSRPKEFNRCLGTVTQSAGHSIKKQNLAKAPSTSATPIACRTRSFKLVNNLKTVEKALDNCAEDTNHLMEVGALEENGDASIDVEASEVLNLKKKRSKLSSNPCGELEKTKRSQPEKLNLKLTAMNKGVDALTYPRGRRSCRNLSGLVNGCDKLVAQPKNSVRPEDIGQPITGHKSSRSNARSTCVNLTVKRKTRSSVHACAISSSLNRSLDTKASEKSLNKPGPTGAVLDPSSADVNVRVKSREFVEVTAVNHSEKKNVIDSQPSGAENAEMNSRLDKSPVGQCKVSELACTSPENCLTPVNAASPVCMGNEYLKQTCKKNLAKSYLVKEINQLISTEPEPISPLKDSRKRRDMSSIRVLFSHHLDGDIIKQQKKILDRLGASEVTSITDATHFVTEKFVRTRNMLEAIASGKPVVTHLWLESIAQVKIHIDEESYLLCDTKKEKEFGFSMPASLARARKHPLLQGRKVLITPNIKPSKETVSSLVKAVHGQAVERMGRSALKDDKVPDDLLILSCEEDYEICEPFLEKGSAVYSSELLLNGIVTQKLEYERHRLFVDNVKRTRSTIWLRKNGHKFHPVSKLK